MFMHARRVSEATPTMIQKRNYFKWTGKTAEPDADAFLLCQNDLDGHYI